MTHQGSTPSETSIPGQCCIWPIPAFDDNYIWLLQFGTDAVVVDPGDAAAVLAALAQYGLTLRAILITHHHQDHIGGVNDLLTQHSVPVYAPQYGSYPFPTVPLKDGDQITLAAIAQRFDIMWLPGHTLDHIAYVNQDYLFCGDTLFGAGCGRLFEGTPMQMLSSLNRLKQLPAATQVFCTHEYTLKNIAFALTLEPDNTELIARKAHSTALRAQGLPTLPSSIGLELATNPFLRCDSAAIIANAHAQSIQEIEVFSTIRQMRNHY
ncbi:MAG TPA: hydroxyacylglutathione hydrolase [Methylophilus sp.]